MADFSIAALIKAIDGVTAPVGRISRSFGALGESAKRVGRQMTVGLTVPTVAFGAMALRTTLGFQEAINKVAAITDAPADKLRELELTARRMGATTQFSATEAAGALAFLAQAGLDADTAMRALPGILNLAAAGGLDLATAGDLATNVLAGMRLEVSDLARVNDVLAKGAASANTDVSQLAEALKTAGPIAADTSMSLEETVSVLGTLANAGFRGQEAGTALRNAIARLVNPSNEAQAAMVRLGITSRDVVTPDGKMVDFTALLNKMRAAGMTTADAMQIFGLRAGPQLLAAIGQGEGAIEGLADALRNSAGEASRQAEARMRGLPGAIKEITSAFSELQLALADSGFADAVTGIIRGVTGIVRRLSEASPATLKWVTIIAAAAAALGPLIAALGFVAIGIGALLTPIGAVVAGIVGMVAILGAAAAGIVMHWEPIKEFFADLWDGVTAGFKRAWNFIQPIAEKIAGAARAITAPLDAIRGLGSSAGRFLGGLFGRGGEDTAANATRNAIPGAVAGSAGRDATARVQVEFPNAPKGARVNSEVRGDGLDLDILWMTDFPGKPI